MLISYPKSLSLFCATRTAPPTGVVWGLHIRKKQATKSGWLTHSIDDGHLGPTSGGSSEQNSAIYLQLFTFFKCIFGDSFACIVTKQWRVRKRGRDGVGLGNYCKPTWKLVASGHLQVLEQATPQRIMLHLKAIWSTDYLHQSQS